MTGMTAWQHAGHLVLMFALGAAFSTGVWGIVLGFSPRRRGRHEAPPELVPATRELPPATPPLPPLDHRPLGPRHGRPS